MPRPRARRPLPRPLLALAALPLLAACGEDGEPLSEASEAAQEAGPAPAEVRADVQDLVRAVTPFDPTLPTGEQSAWFHRRRDTLERLRGAGRAHGLEALRVYREDPDALPQVRAGLLDVAAHAAPEEALPVLVELVEEYGDDLAVRTKAAELLPVASPERALEVIEPILLGERTGRTYPAEDMLLEAWSAAMVALGRDRVPLLTDVATDIPREIAVRHAAVRMLGTLPSPRGRAALEELLVESSGNHHLRRLAAQSLRDSLPPEEVCPILERVLANESDDHFAIFLDDMIQKTCP